MFVHDSRRVTGTDCLEVKAESNKHRSEKIRSHRISYFRPIGSWFALAESASSRRGGVEAAWLPYQIQVTKGTKGLVILAWMLDGSAEGQFQSVRAHGTPVYCAAHDGRGCRISEESDMCDREIRKRKSEKSPCDSSALRLPWTTFFSCSSLALLLTSPSDLDHWR
ncbi:hypothetical protein M231_07115 [Tremella mesenterica]|uniref:Uncharacterized protein n=1 Tax=Tremella mesenterica TaxID=5217 RepID=A0A4Q1BEM0_TREME|nr:hypothetical protein M231_07115 [Tremella mesenterica]